MKLTENMKIFILSDIWKWSMHKSYEVTGQTY